MLTHSPNTTLSITNNQLHDSAIYIYIYIKKNSTSDVNEEEFKLTVQTQLYL